MAISLKDYESIEAMNQRIFELIDIIKVTIHIYPELSMNCARQISEAICAKTILQYNLVGNFPTDFIHMLSILNKHPEIMPSTRYIAANTLREWGNVGSHFHVDKMNAAEAITALSALDNLLEWWFKDVAPNCIIPMQYRNLRDLPLSAPTESALFYHSPYRSDISSDHRLISTHSVRPKPVFCGRMDTLSEIFIKFQHEGEHVIFLHGMGGIGKTQIAKQYAKKFKNQYDTIIHTTYNGSLKELILSDSDFKFEPKLTRFTLADGTLENDDSFYERKLELLKECTNERTLIIIDNFDVESDENLFDLLEGNYHLLFTTRCDYSASGLTFLNINPIESMDDLISIFMQNYTKGSRVQASDSDLVQLIELINRHTYTIELLARHMRLSNQSASEMIAALKQKGISALDKNLKDERLQTRKAYENLLTMFRIFSDDNSKHRISLSEEERCMLMYLSLMPLEGVNNQDFIAWSGAEDADLLISLEERSWILPSSNGIALHPIIREVVRHELPANEQNCREFIHRFCDSISELTVWHATKETKDRYAAIAKELLSCFHTITPNVEELYYRSGVLFSFAVDPVYAVEIEKRLFDYCNEVYDENTYEFARIAFRIGWTYAYNRHLAGADEASLYWLSLAYNTLRLALEKEQLNTNEQRAALNQTLCNLAKSYLLRYNKTQSDDDYSQALKYADDNLSYTQKSFVRGTPHYSRIGGAYLQLTDILLAGAEYEKALNNANEALTLLYDIYQTEENGDYAFGLSRKASALYGLGRHSEAEKTVTQSLVRYARFFGENNPEVYQMYIQRGDCRTALRRFKDARSDYKKARSILSSICAPDSPQFDLVQQKLENVDTVETDQ